MLTQTTDADQSLTRAVSSIAEDVAAVHADEVDRDARFPREAVAAIRDAGLLSALVPSSLGGLGASLDAVADSCYLLGRHCAATAMVCAMHHSQILMIAQHRQESPWFDEYLRRVAAEQRLVASITSEKGTGGDMGRSSAAVVTRESGTLGFTKEALTISYAASADDFLTTLRRSETSAETDQVFVLHLGEDTTLTQTGTWDTLGMRGTCSPGFIVEAAVEDGQILPDPVSVVVNETLPVAYVLWSHVWLGIASAAFERAHRFVRAAARRTPGEPVPAATALSHLASDLSVFRSNVRLGLIDFVNADREAMHLMPTIMRFDNLKISSAERASRICLGALEIVGVAGYRNDSPYSVGRHLRDALSAPLMVSNDRIHAEHASLLAVVKEL